jgi:hypothetical protein
MLEVRKINGTKGLYINSDLKIIDKLGVDNWDVYDDLIALDMYNKFNAEFKLEFLYNLSGLDINYPIVYNNIFSFDFVKIKRKFKGVSKDVVISILNKPIEVLLDGVIYRVISILPRYAISMSGKVLDLKTLTFVSVTNYYNKNNNEKYPAVQLFNNDGTRTSRGMHRLMGFAWVKNTDWVNNKVINHIDGDKNNYAIDNLEWITPSENANHAIASGLRYDNHGIKIRNIDTGEITTYPSITLATEYIGRSRLSVTHANPVGTGRVVTGLRGRFELKYANDNTEWISVGRPYKIITKGQKLRFTVVINDTVHVCNNSKDLNTIVENFFPDFSENEFTAEGEFSRGIKKFQRYFPLIPNKVENIYDNKDKTYICLDMETNKLVKATDRADVMRVTNGSKSTIQKSITSNGAYTINNRWRAKVDDGIPFAELVDIANKRTPVKLTKDTETKVFSSLREAANYLNIDRKMLKKLIKEKNPFNGYYISYE